MELNDNSNAFNAFQRATKLEPENHLIFLNFALFLADSDQDGNTLGISKEMFEKHDSLYSSIDKNCPEFDQIKA